MRAPYLQQLTNGKVRARVDVGRRPLGLLLGAALLVLRGVFAQFEASVASRSDHLALSLNATTLSCDAVGRTEIGGRFLEAHRRG
jgi:hypothetical protein